MLADTYGLVKAAKCGTIWVRGIDVRSQSDEEKTDRAPDEQS